MRIKRAAASKQRTKKQSTTKSLLYVWNMIETNERSSFRCSTNCCCVDDKCVSDENRCECVYALKSINFATASDDFTTTHIVMLEKWLHDVKIDKHIAPANDDDIDLSASLVQRQRILLNQSQQRSHSFTEYHSNNSNNNNKNSNQMEYPNQISCDNSKKIEQAAWTQSMNSIRCSHLFDRCHRSAHGWTGSSKSSKKHCQLSQTENKAHQTECSNSSRSNNGSSSIHEQQPYNLTSTKFMNDNASLIGDDRDKGCCISGAPERASKNCPQINASNSMSGKCATSVLLPVVPLSPLSRSPATASAKVSLKFVHRSPLSIIHRASLLPIFIKYLLILNCFVCFASGNLMARNIGNDLSSKHNHSNPIDSATTGAGATPSIHNNNNSSSNGSRKGTTMSPLILQSLISNNRSQLFQSASQQSSSSGSNSSSSGSISNAESARARQFLQQHAQDALASGYVSDEPVSSFKVANADEVHSGSEEFSRCASCQFREQLKAQNLASIKMHILARLSMTHPPNITGRPHISEQILQTFYQNNDFRYIRIRNGSNGASSPFLTDDDLNEMQGDDPNVSMGNPKHQHHHVHGHEHEHEHEYRGNVDSGGSVGGGGQDGLINSDIKSELNEQHHHHQSSYHHHNRHTRYVIIIVACKL